MCESRIGICDPGVSTESRHDQVDRPQRHRTMAIAEKDRPRFPTADEHEQITEICIMNDGNDPCFAAFALVDGHPVVAWTQTSKNLLEDGFVLFLCAENDTQPISRGSSFRFNWVETAHIPPAGQLSA